MKKSINIMFMMFILIISLSISPVYSLDIIHQEDANSTSCVGAWHGTHTCANVLDGNYDTYGTKFPYDTISVKAYMNYSVPSGYEPYFWHIKNDIVNQNKSISSCSYSPLLQFRGTIYNDGSTVNTTYECYTGSEWLIIQYSPNTNALYDESVYFKNMISIDSPLNQTYNTTSLSLEWSIGGDVYVGQYSLNGASNISSMRWVQNDSLFSGISSAQIVYDTFDMLGSKHIGMTKGGTYKVYTHSSTTNTWSYNDTITSNYKTFSRVAYVSGNYRLIYPVYNGTSGFYEFTYRTWKTTPTIRWNDENILANYLSKTIDSYNEVISHDTFTYGSDTYYLYCEDLINQQACNKWNSSIYGGSTWDSDNTFINGLSTNGEQKPYINTFNYNSKLSMIMSGRFSTPLGYYWNGSEWLSYSSLSQGLDGIENSIVFNNDNKYTLLSTLADTTTQRAYEYKLYSPTITAVKGTNNITIFVNDTVGNSNQMTVYFTVTNQVSFSDNSTNSTHWGSDILHSLKATSSENGFSSYIFSFDNGTGTFVNDSSSSLSGTTSWANVTKSVNTTVGSPVRWRVFVNDSSDNLYQSDVYSYTTTNDVPNVTVQYPANTTYGTNWVWTNVTVSDLDSISLCSVSLNSTSNQSLTNSTGNWNFNLSVPSEGSNNVVIYCNDSYGLVGSTQIYFTIDTVHPVINSVSNNITDVDLDLNLSVLLSSNVTDVTSSISSVIYQVTWQDGSVVNYTASGSNPYTYILPINYTYAQSVGNVTYESIATDIAGNSITSSEYTIRTSQIVQSQDSMSQKSLTDSITATDSGAYMNITLNRNLYFYNNGTANITKNYTYTFVDNSTADILIYNSSGISVSRTVSGSEPSKQVTYTTEYLSVDTNTTNSIEYVVVTPVWVEWENNDLSFGRNIYMNVTNVSSISSFTFNISMSTRYANYDRTIYHSVVRVCKTSSSGDRKGAVNCGGLAGSTICSCTQWDTNPVYGIGWVSTPSGSNIRNTLVMNIAIPSYEGYILTDVQLGHGDGYTPPAPVGDSGASGSSSSLIKRIIEYATKPRNCDAQIYIDCESMGENFAVDETDCICKEISVQQPPSVALFYVFIVIGIVWYVFFMK